MVRTRFAALCAAGVLLGAAADPLVALDDREALVGVWRYAGEIDTLPDGKPAPVEALSATQGLLVYTADGFVSVDIMPKERRWATETATLEELRETVGNGTAYAGRYEVDPASHTVTHITTVSMEPAFEGQRLARTYALDGDRLLLSGTFPYEGQTVHFAITWTREAPLAPVASLEPAVRARLDAYARRDVAAWSAFVDDAGVYGGASKKALAAEISGRPAKVENWYGEIGDFTVSDHGGFAMVHYRVTEFTEIGGQRLAIAMKRTETHVRRGDRWLLVAGADTILPHDPPTVKLDPKVFDAYVGKYEYTPGLVDTVAREGNRLFVQSTGQERIELFPENPTTFYAAGEDWRVVFDVVGADKAKQLRFRQNGQDLIARRLP